MTLERRTLLVAAVLVAVSALAAPIYRGEMRTQALQPLAPLSRAFAVATAGTLRLLAVDVVQEDTILRHPGGFALEVTANCTACFHVVLYLTGLFALRLRARSGRGSAPSASMAAGGVAVLATVNLARLALIFLVGVRTPMLFEWSHHFAGEALLAGTVLLLWWRAGVPRAAPQPPRALALRAE